MTFEQWKLKQVELGNLWPSLVSSGRTKKGDLVGHWKTKYRAKEKNAKKEGLAVLLTFDEYLYKLFEAGITSPIEIGVQREKYQLARFKDEGNYTVESCRFITKKENEEEKSQEYQSFGAKVSANKSSILAWSKADQIYDLWKNHKMGRYKISREFNRRDDKKFIKACENIIQRRFKQGWVPMNDEKWKKWKANV